MATGGVVGASSPPLALFVEAAGRGTGPAGELRQLLIPQVNQKQAEVQLEDGNFHLYCPVSSACTELAARSPPTAAPGQWEKWRRGQGLLTKP